MTALKNQLLLSLGNRPNKNITGMAGPIEKNLLWWPTVFTLFIHSKSALIVLSSLGPQQRSEGVSQSVPQP
jgi:hypothetical protein